MPRKINFLRYRDDPLHFVRVCWPELQLYRQQADVLESVATNIETYVHTGNKVGKSFVASLVAIHFFVTRTPARVICMSTKQDQLKQVLWPEINQLINTSELPFPFRQMTLRVDKTIGPTKHQQYIFGSQIKNTHGRFEKDYMIGHVAQQVESFQGPHLDQDIPRVLWLCEEASGVGDEWEEAANSWRHRSLVIGNPLNNENFFYRNCRDGDMEDPAGSGGLLRKVIHIDVRDTPNVRLGLRMASQGKQTVGMRPLVRGIKTYDDFVRDEAKMDPVQKETRLYGNFYVGHESLLFPMEILDEAEKRWLNLKDKRKVEAIGLDIAAGRDLTCWVLADRHGVISIEARKTTDTMEICGYTMRLNREHRLPPDSIAVDSTGLGTTIPDRLSEQGLETIRIGFGESAEDKQAYINRRAEIYGNLSRWVRDREFALPPGEGLLRQELAVLPIRYDSEGRLKLPPKDARTTRTRSHEKSIREILGRSPDRADALALAVWALRRVRVGDMMFRPAAADTSNVEKIREMTKQLEQGLQETMTRMQASMKNETRGF